MGNPLRFRQKSRRTKRNETLEKLASPGPPRPGNTGEEFGETRLVEVTQAQRHVPAAALLEAVVAAVRQFSGREQADGVTVSVARVR